MGNNIRQKLVTNKIEKLDHYVLLNHFKDAVCDKNYNLSSEKYNKSEFTYEELEWEILKRMQKSCNL